MSVVNQRETAPLLSKGANNYRDISDVAEVENTALGMQFLTRHAPMIVPKSLARTGKIFGGIRRELSERMPQYYSDIVDGLNSKTFAAVLFMFFATFASTVALGDVAERETEGKVGISEYLILQGVSGMGHALFSACPMPILRPTGPITAFMGDLHRLSVSLQVEYFSLLGLVGLWVGLFLCLIAMFDLSAYICLCTRFLHDIYGVFVCTIYIHDGLNGIHERFEKAEWASAQFALTLGLLVIAIATVLTYFRKARIFTKSMRGIISDYALTIAVFFVVALSYSNSVQTTVDRLSLPRDYKPTYNHNTTSGAGYSDMIAAAGAAGAAGGVGSLGGGDYGGMVPRAWMPGLSGPGWLWLVALLASIPIVALFFFDQLFSCILGQKKELGIAKGEYYHTSFFIIGICNAFCPLFGLPFVTASLPHSPQFVKALTERDQVTGRLVKVHESRLAPFMVYFFCFIALAVPQVLEVVPEGVVNGILTFVGLAGIFPGEGNQFVDRVVLLFTHPKEHPRAMPYVQSTSTFKMHMFTIIQLLCLAACWGMRFTGDFALAFPLVVVAFVPLRLKVLPKWFSEEELAGLDSEHSVDEYQNLNNGSIREKDSGETFTQM